MLEFIKNYFAHIPSAHRALLLAGGISFFWLVEIAVPLLILNTISLNMQA